MLGVNPATKLYSHIQTIFHILHTYIRHNKEDILFSCLPNICLITEYYYNTPQHTHTQTHNTRRVET